MACMCIHAYVCTYIHTRTTNSGARIYMDAHTYTCACACFPAPSGGPLTPIYTWPFPRPPISSPRSFVSNANGGHAGTAAKRKFDQERSAWIDGRPPFDVLKQVWEEHAHGQGRDPPHWDDIFAKPTLAEAKKCIAELPDDVRRVVQRLTPFQLATIADAAQALHDEWRESYTRGDRAAA